MPIIYKNLEIDYGYRLDLLVENKVVVELKTVETFSDVHFAQLLTYLRLGGFQIGLLMNFHVARLKNGNRRIINSKEFSANL